MLALAANCCNAAIITVLASGTVNSIHEALLTDAKRGDMFTVEYTIDTSLLTSTFPTGSDPPFSEDAITSFSLSYAPLVSPGVFGPSNLEFESTDFGSNANNNEVRVTEGLLSFSASLPDDSSAVAAGSTEYSKDYDYNRVKLQLLPLDLDPNTTDIANTIVNGINNDGYTPSVEILTTYTGTDANGVTNATILLNNTTVSSFVVSVPEPSSFALATLLCAVPAFRRKRPAFRRKRPAR